MGGRRTTLTQRTLHPLTLTPVPGLTLRPRSTDSGLRLVDRRVLAHFGFTDHALARFAQRAGIHGDPRRDIEPILRDLLLIEGTWTAQPPHWALSRKPADTYLQIGTWMCLLGRSDTFRGRGHYSIVTAINGPAHNDWANALKHGYIHLPPPPPRFAPSRPRVTWRDSFRIARQRGNATSTATLRLLHAVHRQRRSAARNAHAHARVRHVQELRDTVRPELTPATTTSSAPALSAGSTRVELRHSQGLVGNSR